MSAYIGASKLVQIPSIGSNKIIAGYVGNEKVLEAVKKFVDKTWNGLPDSALGYDIWTDGENYYYSSKTTNYVLNKETGVWVTKTWSGISSYTLFAGRYIWSDGDNIYHSRGSAQYVLNKSTGVWSTKTWGGANTKPTGTLIWTDGTNIYWSDNTSNQYVLDKATSAWNTKTWDGLIPGGGQYIWTDGTDIYYSFSDTDQYVLNKATGTFETKTWIGVTKLGGVGHWTDGVDHFISSEGQTVFGTPGTYRLIPNTNVWELYDVGVELAGNNVFNIDGNIYYKASSISKQLTEYIS